jgi:hypothetical protein
MKKPVYCSYCNELIFEYLGPETAISWKAANFVPARKDINPPQAGQALRCPLCQIQFVGVSQQSNQLRLLVSWHYQGTGDIGKRS